MWEWNSCPLLPGCSAESCELRERVVEGCLATHHHGKRRDKLSQPIWNPKKANALEELEIKMKSQMEVQDLIEDDYLVIVRFT